LCSSASFISISSPSMSNGSVPKTKHFDAFTSSPPVFSAIMSSPVKWISSSLLLASRIKSSANALMRGFNWSGMIISNIMLNITGDIAFP
ncbi:hypothetical protein ADUPG1_004494, partial [Aduncisulcus paluster]